MRPKPRDALQAKILQSPAAAAAAASVTAAYALAKAELLDLTERKDSNDRVIPVDSSQKDLSIEINIIREEKKKLESSMMEVNTEKSALKARIEEASGYYAELSKVG